MTSSVANHELWGWTAAVCSMLAFGSFGAPIKSEASKSVDVDPLVFQSYKTGMCFITSWLVLLIRGQEFSYTPWGIVSGLFWVPGGVATIYAVKTAGLAVGIGLGSSCIVLVSFVWGIFIFDESVESRWGACSAVFFIILGICGMAYFSSPKEGADVDDPGMDARSHGSKRYHELQRDDIDVIEQDGLERFEGDTLGRVGCEISSPTEEVNSSIVKICHFRIRKRTLGLVAAVFNGVWGGSIMVPMHWSG